MCKERTEPANEPLNIRLLMSEHLHQRIHNIIDGFFITLEIHTNQRSRCELILHEGLTEPQGSLLAFLDTQRIIHSNRITKRNTRLSHFALDGCIEIALTRIKNLLLPIVTREWLDDI